MSKYKSLNVGDLHLYNQEIRSTLRMVDNNEVMLEALFNYIKQDKYIIMVNFMGDLQHRTPKGDNTLSETRKWIYWLTRIGKLLRNRWMKLNLLEEGVTVISRNDEDDFLKKVREGKAYPLFTLFGNHDMDKKKVVRPDGTNATKNLYTFYDMLIDDGIVYNPLTVILSIKGTVTQFEYFNYGEPTREWTRHAGVKQVVGLFHDTIDAGELDFGLIQGTTYRAEEICDNMDLVLVGHVHKLFEPLPIVTDGGTETIFWVTGSMGRTAFTDGQIRDVGYCAEFVLGDLTQVGVVEIDLIPKEQYFNYKEMLMQKKKRQDYKSFSIQIEGVKIDRYDPRNDIQKLKDVSDEVKDLCSKYLTVALEGDKVGKR